MKWHTTVVCLSAVTMLAGAGVVPEETTRIKRSGSGDIGALISSAISSKIQSIASASASLSAASSSSSSKHHPTEAPKQFTFWEYKKALLGTLLNAVKAIKGGILALKGHLIKAKGNLLSAKGRLVAAKGEKVTEFGKQIAASALGLGESDHPPMHHPVNAGYASGPAISTGYGYSTGSAYGGPPPAPPSSSYGVPTGPSSYYSAAFNHARESRSTMLPEGVQAGLLVIKPIVKSKPSFVSSFHDDLFFAPSQMKATFVPAPFSLSNLDTKQPH